MLSEAKYQAAKRTALKILTPKQMLQRLSINQTNCLFSLSIKKITKNITWLNQYNYKNEYYIY